MLEQAEEVIPMERPLLWRSRFVRPQADAETKKRWLGLALACVAGISYGIQGPLAKIAYNNGSNIPTLLTMRFGVAAIGIWLVVGLVRPQIRQPRKALFKLWFLGAIFVMNSLTFYAALNELAAGTATLLVFSFPALVVILSVIFFKERLTRIRVIALGLALFGCALTVDPVAALAPGQNFSWLGVFLVGLGAVTAALYVLLSGRFSQGVPGLVAAAWGIPVTALIYSVWSFGSGSFTFAMTPLGWASAVAIGLLSAFSIATFLIGVQMIGPSRAAIASTSEPATAVIMGILLLGEPASLVKLVGGALIITAIILLSRKVGDGVRSRGSGEYRTEDGISQS